MFDPENVTAHHNLHLLYVEMDQPQMAEEHRRLHQRYKPDDNAQGRAARQARQRYPAANHAAEAVVKYQLQRHDEGEVEGRASAIASGAAE